MRAILGWIIILFVLVGAGYGPTLVWLATCVGWVVGGLLAIAVLGFVLLFVHSCVEVWREG